MGEKQVTLVIGEDPGLNVPPPPPLVDALPAVPARPRREGAARDERPLTVSGRRVRLAGSEGAGIEQVWMETLRVAHALRVRARPDPGQGQEPAGHPPADAWARPTSIVVAPGAFERVLGPERLVVERGVAAAVLPAAVLEWRAGEAPVELLLSWACDLRPPPPGLAEAVRWRREGAALLVVGADGGEGVVFAVSDPAAEWRTGAAAESDTGAPPLRVEVRALLGPGASLRLLVAGGADAAERARVLGGLRRSGDLVHARAAGAARLRQQRLQVVVPDSSHGSALEWAAHGLDAGRREVARVGRALTAEADWPPGGAGWGAVAALGIGDGELARETFLFLGAHQDAAGRVPDGLRSSGILRHDAPGAASLYLLLAARILAWTGDRSLLTAEWPRVERALEHVASGAGARPPSAAGAGEGALRDAAIRELAVAAEELGRAATLARLRSLLAAPAPENRPPPSPGGAAALLLGLRGAQAERDGAVLPPHEPDAMEPGAALRVAAWTVAGLLGAHPDAPRHRLELRPRLPAGWQGLEATGLRMGEAVLDLRYSREGGRHLLRLEQVGGAVPVRVILAPEVEGTLVEARVDGQPAELTPRVEGGRTSAPVQIVLDAERRVELRTAVEG